MRNLKSLTFLLLANTAFATSPYDLSTNLDVLKHNNKTQSSFSGDFGIQSNQVVENVGDVIGNEHFGELNLQYKGVNSKNRYIGAAFSTRINDQNEMMYSLEEGLIEFRYSTSRLAFGRTNLAWSEADKHWGLGKINNRKNFDYFKPGQEGLIGVFYDKEYQNGINVGIFLSGIYAPELNPSLQVNKSEGTIECKNPWCKAPSASAPVEGKEVPIYYNVNYPEVSEAVMKESVGLKIGREFEVLNSKDLNVKLGVSAYGIRKPENTVSVAAEIKYVNADRRILVDATPQFYYHQVKGVNLDLDIEEWNLRLYGSGISTTPETRPVGDQPYIEYTGIKPKKLNEDYLSGGLIYNNNDLFKTHLSYIARVSPFDRKSDLLVEYPRWNQAYNIGFEVDITRKLSLSLDYKYDMLTEDRLTMLNSSYSVGRGVVVSLGANIIGTDSKEESFWSDFENNDSVYSSLKYIF